MWVVFWTWTRLLRGVFIPDWVISVVGMEQLFCVFINMPEGIIDGGIGVFLLALMGKRAPPILHNLDEVHGIAQKRDGHWAIHFAVEYPEPFVMRYREYAWSDDGLRLVVVPMRDPCRHKIPVPFHVLGAQAPQMPAHERDADEYKWRRRKEWEVYQRNTDDDAEKYGSLLEILTELYSLKHFVELYRGIHIVLIMSNT